MSTPGFGHFFIKVISIVRTSLIWTISSTTTSTGRVDA
jgi:hypothetical protein